MSISPSSSTLAPFTLYGYVTQFFMKIYKILEKARKFPGTWTKC